MYAKKIALLSARTQARIERDAWNHLAHRVAQTEGERERALDMAARWDIVAAHLGRLIARGKSSFTAPEYVEVANALVTHKSEVAHKVDHG